MTTNIYQSRQAALGDPEFKFNDGYIVMPPGTGKSARHNPDFHILEADTVVDCRQTRRLRFLRAQARRTGDWTEYDKVWTQMLLVERIDYYMETQAMKVVWLVPSHSIGLRLEAKPLGELCLADEPWAINLQTRGKSPSDYEYCFDDYKRTNENTYMSNDALSTAFQTLIIKFATTL